MPVESDDHKHILIIHIQVINKHTVPNKKTANHQRYVTTNECITRLPALILFFIFAYSTFP